jgi:integrase
MESRTKMGQRRSAVQDDFYLFPVGAVYYVKFRDPITRQLLSKKSTGQRNKIAARHWAQAEWDRRTERAGKSDMILYDYAKLFYTGDGCPHETDKKAKGEHFAIRTRKLYRSHLVNLILPDPICQKEIAFIKRADAIAFRDRVIQHCGYTRKAQLVFQTFKNILHTALEKGIIDTDPVQRLGIAHTKEKRKATKVDNLKSLFEPENWSNSRIRLAVMTAGLVGLRAGEVRGIKWRDIDNENDIIRVDREIIDVEGEKLPKWEKTRVTIYPSQLKPLLEPLRSDPDCYVFSISKKGHPLSYSRLRREMNEATKKSGIPHITLHGLRHSIQTALRGGGVNPELLRATFGWTAEEVQECYTHRELYDLTPQREITDTLFRGINGKTGNN